MKRIEFQVDELTYRRLTKTCKETGKTMSNFLREIIQNNFKKADDTPIMNLIQILLKMEAQRKLDNEALRGDLKTIFQQTKVTDVKAQTVSNFVKSIKDDSKRILAIQRSNLIMNDKLAEVVKSYYPIVVKEALEIRDGKNKK